MLVLGYLNLIPGLLKAQAPEQDCFNAINVCTQSFSQADAFSGFGAINEIPVGAGCLQNGEVNSVWYAFTIFQAGNLTLQLNPLNLNDDYDFAIYNLTNDSCSGIAQGLNLPVRCNYSASPGSTGLSNGASLTTSGTSDPNQLAPLSVTAGETYVMVVSNFTSSQTGYSIDFGGSASVVDQQNPHMAGVDIDGSCNPSRVFIDFTEQIECASIAADGSDFTLSGPSPETIVAANSVGCTPEGYCTRIRLTFSNSLSATGNHIVTAGVGSDGNTILDRCGNALNAGANENFNVQFLGPELIADGVVNSDCGQETGSATVDIIGGTGPFNYEWNTTPTQYGMSATDLPPGFWVCTVTDANGCEDSQMMPVEGEGEPEVTTVSTSPVTCNGISDGQAEIDITGNGPFNVAWGGYPNLSGTSATGLSGGSVVLTITDNSGCSVNHVVNISIPPSLSTPVSSVNPNCNQSDGEMIVQASGGTEPYTFNWSHDANLNNDSALGLPAGIYNVTVTDSNGCFATAQAVLVDNFAPNATIGASTPDCGQNSGSAMVLPTNGTPPYTFLWNDPAGQTTQTATGLVEGDYFVTITDAGGCVQIISVKIDEVAKPEASYVATDATCGVNDGTVDITVTGGVVPYTYVWNTHPNYSNANETTLWADSYNVTVVDSIGCVTSVQFEVEQELPTSEIFTENDCQDHLFEFRHTTTSMATDFFWDFGDGNTSTDSVAYHYYSTPGSYNVTLQLLNGCLPDEATSTSTVYPMPEPSYTVEPEVVTTRIDAEFTYTGTPGAQYIWDLGDGTGSTMVNPTGDYPFEGDYPITLTVTTEHGCVTTIQDNLRVELAPALFFPNAFVPNGTFKNSRYRIGGIGLTSIEFVIMDRWGSEMYFSTSPDQVMNDGWDGYYKGSPAPPGVYAYRVKASFFEGTKFEDTGTITLLR